MATVTTVPLEVYLRSSYEPDAEYVDGIIEERPVVQLDHAKWQRALLRYFDQHRNEWNVEAYAELHVQVAQTRFRIPDVTVLDRAAPTEQIVTTPPIAVFEILSPEDAMQRMLVKLADYERMSIGGIFLIDPATGTYWRQEGSLRSATDEERVGDRFTISFPKIRQYLD